MNGVQILDILKQNEIPLQLWGVGDAKSYSHFLDELSKEESYFDYKNMVRVLNVVKMVIKNRLGKTLYEANQELKNGVIKKRMQIPSEKITKSETVLEAALRGILEELQIKESYILKNRVLPFFTQEIRKSASYPGLISCYNLFYVEFVIYELPNYSFITEEIKSNAGDYVSTHFWEWV
ncbi:hypothetical protein JXR93_11405 [bacterium]|nr:hypothetical protein [bacterium]